MNVLLRARKALAQLLGYRRPSSDDAEPLDEIADPWSQDPSYSVVFGFGWRRYPKLKK